MEPSCPTPGTPRSLAYDLSPGVRAAAHGCRPAESERGMPLVGLAATCAPGPALDLCSAALLLQGGAARWIQTHERARVYRPTAARALKKHMLHNPQGSSHAAIIREPGFLSVLSWIERPRLYTARGIRTCCIPAKSRYPGVRFDVITLTD